MGGGVDVHGLLQQKNWPVCTNIKVPPYNTFHDSRQKKIKMYK